MDILDIVITNVPEVVSLWVTSQVVIEPVEEHAGNQLCVLCHGQLVWQFRNLPTHLEDLPQAWKPNIFTSRYLFTINQIILGVSDCVMDGCRCPAHRGQY